MNKRNISILLSFIFIFILSIACVSASEDIASSTSSNGLDDSNLADSTSGSDEIIHSDSSSDSNLDLDTALPSESLESENSQIDNLYDKDNSYVQNSSDSNALLNEDSSSNSKNSSPNVSSKKPIKAKVGSKIKTDNKINTYYKEKTSLNIYLKDSNNKILKNKDVKIILNGKTFIKKTDNKGNIKFPLDLKPGKYNLKIVFVGDEKYKKSSANTKITIKKAPLSIKTKNFSTYFHSDIFFTAKVINNITKNPVEGVKVLFKVYSSRNKYKNYFALTDKKGIASLNKNLKVGSYDIYTYLNDSKEKGYLSYRNLKNKVTLKVKETAEMGCSSIYVYVSENESVVAFRRDSTYAANLHIVVEKWHGRKAVKQYKLTGTYFFHAIATSDGWLMGTGGWDNPTVNKKIEKLAGKIVSTNSLKKSNLKAIRKVEARLPTGHFAIVAPDGRYAVIWKSGYIKGKLKNGEYLKVPNARSLFRHGKFKKFSADPATAAHKIAATDSFGINRRNIMTYHYKRTSRNYKTSSTVTVYGANDKGNLMGRHTAHLKDNVYFKKTYISKNKLSGTPKKKLLGTHNFGNIDSLIKTKTKLTTSKLTSNFNQTKYFKVTLKDKKTNKALKGVKITLKITTGNKSKNYVVKTDKNGLAKFNAKSLKVGTHKVTISPANHKYIISGKSTIVIKAVKTKTQTKNSTSANTTKTNNTGVSNGTNENNGTGSDIGNGTDDGAGTGTDTGEGTDVNDEFNGGNGNDAGEGSNENNNENNSGHPTSPINPNIHVVITSIRPSLLN